MQTDAARELAASVPSFRRTMASHSLELRRKALETLQINLGKLCNQACHHCHVEAGPKRKEIMDSETVDQIISLLRSSSSVRTVDLTGGAPELNPHFRKLVRACREMKKKVMDRCNLTVFFERGQEETPKFLADHQVEVIASLPCYSQKNVDQQRGRGVFEKSIEALLILNHLGYGKPGTGLVLNLVYNPVGAFLPPGQEKLEAEYKVKLRTDFGIEFNSLFTITNMPIRRFQRDLERTGQAEAYLQLLHNHFNPSAVKSVMCRNLLSIGWDGKLFDCDFNQMLEISLPSGSAKDIWEVENLDEFNEGSISIADHCYGCTAGAGSSCGGSLT